MLWYLKLDRYLFVKTWNARTEHGFFLKRDFLLLSLIDMTSNILRQRSKRHYNKICNRIVLLNEYVDKFVNKYFSKITHSHGNTQSVVYNIFKINGNWLLLVEINQISFVAKIVLSFVVVTVAWGSSFPSSPKLIITTIIGRRQLRLGV